MERRSVRSKFNSNGNTLEGYAITFGNPTEIRENGRTFNEVVSRSAINFAEDVIATYNHRPEALLGRLSSGTLSLTVDNRGVKFSVQLPDTATGNEVKTLVERGDITGASFTFSVRPGGEVWDRSTNTRTLTALDVFELGPVTLPAYKSTTVGLRSVNERYKLKLKLREKS
jgi:HK97 family phage prohead protease